MYLCCYVFATVSSKGTGIGELLYVFICLCIEPKSAARMKTACCCPEALLWLPIQLYVMVVMWENVLFRRFIFP